MCSSGIIGGYISRDLRSLERMQFRGFVYGLLFMRSSGVFEATSRAAHDYHGSFSLHLQLDRNAPSIQSDCNSGQQCYVSY